MALLAMRQGEGMRLFLDTEFTGFSHSAQDRKLISLGLVSEDGHAEWYAEIDGWALDDCDPWVQRNVLSLLTGPFMPRCDARISLLTWFSERPRRVQIACDSEIDWRFLLDLLGVRPINLEPQRHDLAPLIDTPEYHNTVTAYFARGHPEHHAMHDARAYRLGWLAWMDATKGRRE